MLELICNTSPLQYLHQLGLLEMLQKLSKRVSTTPAVIAEIEKGRSIGIHLPTADELRWIAVRKSAMPSVFAPRLGLGEISVLAVALEIEDSIAVLDDRLARQTARELGLKFTGTLGLLVDAKKIGHISSIRQEIERLEKLNFRISDRARRTVLSAANEWNE